MFLVYIYIQYSIYYMKIVWLQRNFLFFPHQLHIVVGYCRNKHGSQMEAMPIMHQKELGGSTSTAEEQYQTCAHHVKFMERSVVSLDFSH